MQYMYGTGFIQMYEGERTTTAAILALQIINKVYYTNKVAYLHHHFYYISKRQIFFCLLAFYVIALKRRMSNHAPTRPTAKSINAQVVLVKKTVKLQLHSSLVMVSTGLFNYI